MSAPGLSPLHRGRQRRREAKLMTADDWNKAYPIKTRVKYVEHDGTEIHTRTTSAARETTDGVPVVGIEGKPGPVSIDWLTVEIGDERRETGDEETGDEEKESPHA